MKTLFTFFLIFVFTAIVFSQTDQNEPKRYSYHISGNVIDEQSKPMAKVLVCFVPAVRPVNSRISCTKTDEKGNYEIGAKDIPDKYIVSASTGDSLLRISGDGEKDARLKSSEVMNFGAKDESREVILQFDAETPNQ